MKTRVSWSVLLAILSFSISFGVSSAAANNRTVIIHDQNATPLEQFAAREVRRYVYLRTDRFLRLRDAASDDADGIVIGSKSSGVFDPKYVGEESARMISGLGPQGYLLKTITKENGCQHLLLAGGSDVSTLYAVYRFAEHLGVRFYLHGDVIPDEPTDRILSPLEERGSPLFELRGIQPFHDFPEGPDWWNPDDYKAIIAQLPKLRMNFIGLHTYPVVEPTVWIGKSDDVSPDGSVNFSYPTRYFNTAQTVGWGFSAKPTSAYACGGARLFDRDDFSSDVMRGLTPEPATAADSNEMFNRVGRMFHEAFTLAQRLGVKTCVGTETPLVVPEPVRARMGASDDMVRKLYEGLFVRIMRTHPLDYYWLWTPENWTWESVKEEQVQATLKDITSAYEALRRVNAPIQLATCGWVLGPQYDRALFDRSLPKDIALSCISRQVGHDPVEPGFANAARHDKWAIPWLEDDPAMTSPQLWVGRMRRDASDALRYGCTGLLGIHWRKRILGPNVSALAQAAWTQGDWLEAANDTSGPVGGQVAPFPSAEIADTDADPLYRDVRYDVSAYRFAVPNGRYQVTLRFCEPFYKAAGKRVFGVRLEDKPVLDSLDIFARVGHNRALDLTFDEVNVADQRLDIDFVKQVEFPSIAALEIHGEQIVMKINCGGPKYEDFAADPDPLPPHRPADDYYLDWAWHEFGPEAAAEAARIFAHMDGRLPRPSNWINGPGGYAPDVRPWDEVRKDYAFVDELAALQASIVGAGHRERFDYWLNTFEFMRATAEMCCVWAEYNRTLAHLTTVSSQKNRSDATRTMTLPSREKLARTIEKAYRHLLQSVTDSGAMGTVCNLEQHTFPKLWDAPGAELEARLGEPLPDAAKLTNEYQGIGRVFLPTVRTSLASGEPLNIRAVALHQAAAREGTLLWRTMGARMWHKQPLAVAARSTLVGQLSARQIRDRDLEYYIRVKFEDGTTLHWPPTAPRLNQTVVIMPE
ncbi:MAG: hypothetical protein HY706_10665 [Candidatus Hydrogenedentes bacterium]|nr:hypothetical protein [Candidatus Hydrogenedentota bacterium]